MENSWRFGQPFTTLTVINSVDRRPQPGWFSELTLTNVPLIHPRDTPQPFSVRGQNLDIPEETAYDRYAFHIRAVPDEHYQPVADKQLRDTGELSTLTFESLHDDGVSVLSAKDIQSSEVGQPNQAVDKGRD